MTLAIGVPLTSAVAIASVTCSQMDETQPLFLVSKYDGEMTPCQPMSSYSFTGTSFLAFASSSCGGSACLGFVTRGPHWLYTRILTPAIWRTSSFRTLAWMNPLTIRTRTFCTWIKAPTAHVLGCCSLMRRRFATPVALVAPIYHDRNLCTHTNTDTDIQTAKSVLKQMLVIFEKIQASQNPHS